MWRNRRSPSVYPSSTVKEQSLEGIICSSNIYSQQTSIQSNTQCAEVLTTCRLHLELNFTICLLYLKASHQSGMLNRCWCMSRHNYGIRLLDCDTHCLSLKFRCFQCIWHFKSSNIDKFKHRQLRCNNKQSTIKIAAHYTTLSLSFED